MTDDTIHTCSYYCERPGCIRAQRDELAARLEALTAAQRPAETVKVPSDDLAHEIWAAAQTAPGEGIEDAVERVAALLAPLQAEIEGLREQLRLSTVDQVNAEAEANDARAEIEALRREVDALREALETCLEMEERPKIIELARAALAAAQQPTEQHPDDAAVDRFAAAMKAKLEKKRQEGRGGWQSMTSEQLSALLHEHVRKGDPVDVANLAMMLHQNGQVIEPPATVVTDEMVEALRAEVEFGRKLNADLIHACALANIHSERLAEALRLAEEHIA